MENSDNNIIRELNRGVREINNNLRENVGWADHIMSAIYKQPIEVKRTSAFDGKNVPPGYGRPSNIKEIYGTN